MTSGIRLLGAWLGPALWLALPALVLERGLDGLWIGLALTLTPLIALGAGPRAGLDARPSRFCALVLFAVAGLLIWANLLLAGDVAAWLGRPRWIGVGAAAAGGFLLTAWRGAGRALPVLLVAAALGVGVPLVELGREVGATPLAAWERVAGQPAFRFPSTSPWVTSGRDLGLARGLVPMLFDEEHRLTAPAGGLLRARALDGTRSADVEWTLGPGQSVTLRPGDRLDRGAALPLQFEAGKRVPGAPASGMAWAEWARADWWRRAGLHLTIVLGGLALLRAAAPAPVSRRGALALGAGLVIAFLWAQAWAVYGVLGAPDLFLGGVSPERLADVGALSRQASPWISALQMMLLGGVLAAFLASSVALRERLAALDGEGGGHIGRDIGLWAAVFGITGAASLWPLRPWGLVVLALGVAAAGLGPATIWSGRGPRAAAVAGVAGLALFAVISIGSLLGGTVFELAAAEDLSRAGALLRAGALRAAGERAAARGTPGEAAAAGRWWAGARDAVGAYPALAAVPLGAAALWLRRRPRRPSRPSRRR